MIHQTLINSRVSNAHTSTSSSNSWQNALKNAFRDPVDLLNFLELPTESFTHSKFNSISFPMLVPLSFAQRMQPKNIRDPLLLQVLPQLNELELDPRYSIDPVGDIKSMVIPGLLHKYHGRVLLTLTGACAIHCRYCFRRHFPYSDANLNSTNLSQILDYIKNNHEVNEVILSGGDPLSLSDRRISELMHQIEAITHVQYLRIHSRLPIVLPERITPELVKLFHSIKLKIVFVIHCNHPNEINSQVTRQLKKLSQVGVHLLNQSVLLRDINDDAHVLANLSKKLFELDIQPYYLHLLDKVSGAQHFDLPRSTAKNIYTKLQETTAGYLVPKMVEEIPGNASKTPYTD
ncbi:Lysine 2,3-aminomutase [hydrothermal vent metagenome]|uniref:L-lysine 2,3-aminomutase n=1 Tax=hydrothermal vent metagenome TaxID=652676 RepID=A0A3B1AKP5_9ZZZZ